MSLLIGSYSFPCFGFNRTTEGDFGGGFFQQSEESSQFREEYEMRRMKQAGALIYCICCIIRVCQPPLFCILRYLVLNMHRTKV